MRNYSQTTVVSGQNVKIQSRHIDDPQNPQPVEFRPSPILLLKYEQTTVVSGQNVKIQSHHIADPQIPQPGEFWPIPILLLKYETIRKQP